ncbi:MAG: class I SAM-dependent methyltransferase [Alphaproteobacteria bacterium]|nr:class I SAM-dependent methyltransferase [Alphaproteobacteria bacterium]
MKYDFLWDALDKVQFGSLTIIMPDKSQRTFKGSKSGYVAHLIIKDMACIDFIVSGGDVAFGESYIEDMWGTENLPNLLCFFTQNSSTLEKFFHARKFKALMLYLSSLFSKNTKVGSKKNIQKHYDLGNDFYELWLDPSMTYSSAYFHKSHYGLTKAQQEKYRHIIDKLQGKKILEIGCGWGGFAEVALENNFEIKSLTISQKQFEYAQKRLNKFGDKINLALQDYREEEGVYDNVVSIEMFEAVGVSYWDIYFNKINKVLKSEGKALIQTITINEEVFEDYKNRVDFIQKHIFPGGVLPSKARMRRLFAKHGFKILSELEFGHDYEKTLRIWLNNFDHKKDQILQLGFSERFIRKWRFYLSYCIAGFSAQRTDVVIFEIQKIQ